MGVSNSRQEEKVLDYQRNWVDVDDHKDGKIPYVKNVNRYGDSDYDDELDPVDVIDEYEADEAMKRPDHKSKDGKGFYDDKIDESDNENIKLLDSSQPKVPKMELSALDKSEIQKSAAEKKSITSVRTGATARTVKFNDTREPRKQMDPQAEKALETDLINLIQSTQGLMKFNKKGLLSFNRFMHLFIIITRHSKE